MLTIGLQGDDDDGDNGYVLDYGAGGAGDDDGIKLAPIYGPDLS